MPDLIRWMPPDDRRIEAQVVSLNSWGSFAETAQAEGRQGLAATPLKVVNLEQFQYLQ
jgi:hypothetical protein